MPYLPFDSNLDDDQKKASQGQPTSPDGSVNISGQSNALSGATNPNAGAQPIGKSGSYANINEYLDANKDNSVSMGNNIADTISNSGNTVKNDISNTQQDFNNQVDKATLSNLSNANKDVDSTVGQANSASADKQVNADQVGRFKDISTANYAGPTDLSGSSNYNQAYQDLNKADQYKNNAQTDAGRYALLQQVFNAPGYSQGQQSLDDALVLGNDQSRAAIANAGKSLNDLDSNWTQAQSDAQATAAARKSQIDSARQYAQDQLNGTRTQANADVDTSLANTKNQWGDTYNQLAGVLSGYKNGELDLTADQAKALGLSDGQRMYNSLSSTPQNLINQQSFDANKAISKDQQARLSVLDQLANQYGASSISKYTDPSLAGTLNDSNYLNPSRLDAEAAAQKAAFDAYAQGANISGSDHEQVGDFKDAYWDANANGTLANYLAGQAPTVTATSGPLPFLGSSKQDAIDRADARYYAAIQDALNSQGYNNIVKVKG